MVGREFRPFGLVTVSSQVFPLGKMSDKVLAFPVANVMGEVLGGADLVTCSV